MLCPRQYQEFFSNRCFLYSSTERSPLHVDVVEFVGNWITDQAHHPILSYSILFCLLHPVLISTHKSSNQEGEVQAKLFTYSNNLTIFNNKKMLNFLLFWNLFYYTLGCVMYLYWSMNDMVKFNYPLKNDTIFLFNCLIQLCNWFLLENR